MQDYQSDDFYDLVWTDRDDIRFYQQICKAYGPRILELGCGTGRVLTKVAQHVERIVGVDLSAYRIELCKKKVGGLDIDVRSRISLFVGNMMDFFLQEKFSLITMPFRGFQHLLSPEEQVKTLANASKLLEAGGYILIDVFNPSIDLLNDETRKEEMMGSEFELQDGTKIVQKDRVADIDFDAQVITAEEILYIEDNDGLEKRIVDTYKVRYTFYDELAAAVRAAGLNIVETYGDYEFSKFGEQNQSSDILMLCCVSPS